MESQTKVYMLVLAGLSDVPSQRVPLFLVFLFIYIVTLAVNLLILLLTIIDFHLDSPMYFFLGTLACLDMCCATVATPRMLFDLITDRRLISVPACITQFYFFIFLTASELSLLAVMSYDRYIAICRPLHYMKIMNWNFCFQLVSIIVFFGAIYSLLHTLFLTKLTFCSSTTLQSFFCDLPQLLRISCSDTFINVLLIFVFGILFGIIILGVTFYPYIAILTTVLKIPSKNRQSKAFSTCSSHLTVVVIFYCTLFFNYFHANASEAKYNIIEDKVVSVFYAILSPFLNPLIYSLRNQELKTSLRRALQKL